MNRLRVNRLGVDSCRIRNVPLILCESAKAVKRTLPYLAKLSGSESIEPKHILVALCIWQPEMVGDIFRGIKLETLSKRLLGMEVNPTEIQRLVDMQKYPPTRFWGPQVYSIFTMAERTAHLVSYEQEGCAVLLFSLFRQCYRDDKRGDLNGWQEIKKLMQDHEVTAEAVQQRFFETNVLKHQEPAPVGKSYGLVIN